MNLRRLAAEIGVKVNWGKVRAGDLLHEAFRSQHLDNRDRRFLSYLLLGSIRHRLTLDWIVKKFSSAPATELPPIVRETLRQALYQILFLDRVPLRAAVFEAVEIIKSCSPKQAAFGNALLRKVAAAATVLEEGTDTTSLPPTRVLPVGQRPVLFAQDLFPDPAADLPRHLAVVHSHPRWLVKRWLARLGEEETVKLLRHNNALPRYRLRANRTRCSADELRARLEADGVGFEEADGDCLLTLPSEGLKYVAEGLARFQGFVAGIPATKAADSPVLELCAAPGGKTLQLCGCGVRVVAADRSAGRLRRLKEALVRAKADALVVCGDSRMVSRWLRTTFRTVLADVPCSNTGVLAQRAEARWRVSPEEIERLSSLQLELVLGGLDAVETGGTLVYSTCSLDETENEAVVRKALELRPGFELGGEELYLPHRTGEDGGYVAVLKRKGA